MRGFGIAYWQTHHARRTNAIVIQVTQGPAVARIGGGASVHVAVGLVPVDGTVEKLEMAWYGDI